MASGPLPSARARTAKSRSVTIPTSFRLSMFSTTGIAPQSLSRISSAASRAVASGTQQAGSRVMKSLIRTEPPG